MKFWKFQANGNDFVLIRREHAVVDYAMLCDRHYGVGADGVLVVDDREKTIQYEHYNADGSSANLCVNGIRCVAWWYFMQSKKQDVMILISKQTYKLHINENGLVTLLTKCPTLLGENLYQIGVKHEIVTHIPRIPEHDRNYDVITYGRVPDNEIWVDTWERGVGPTLSCGSGMIASFYHAYREGRVGLKGKVHSAGGTSSIVIKNNSVVFQSPVYFVFEGFYLAR